ncbi:hypothetical protein BH23PSE1_BH23PSE1_11520 [soil metagenome]
MPIAIVIIALVAYIYAMLAYPEYRTLGLVGGGLAAIGLGAYLWTAEPEAERSASRIAPEELTLDELVLDRSARGATLTGRVRNGSPEFRLREITLALRLYDCPDAEAALAECATIGDAAAIARPDAPPGQVRGFTASYVFANMPALSGILLWEWEIMGIRATAGR